MRTAARATSIVLASIVIIVALAPLASAAGGNLTVSTSSIDFGSIPATTRSAAQTVTVTNTGGGDVFFSSVSVTTGFSLALDVDTCAGQTIRPGESCDTAARFVPSTLGPQAGELFLGSDGFPSPIRIRLSGIATPSLVTSPGSLDFGSVPVTTRSAAQSVRITNLGGSPVFFGSMSVTTDFGLDLSGESCGGRTVAPGESCTAGAVFAPSSVGAKFGSYFVRSDRGVPDTLTIPLSGEGLSNLRVEPGALDFGSMPATQRSAPQAVTVTNVGGVPIWFNSASVTDGFGLDFADRNCVGRTLAPGETCVASAYFTPQTLGAFNGEYALGSDRGVPNRLTIPMTGVATPSLVFSPSVVDFGETPAFHSSTLPVDITNVGGVPVRVNSLSTGGSFFLGLELNTCFGRTIEPGESCRTGAAFRPDALGPTFGTLTIGTDRGVPSTLHVPLRGIGTSNLVADAAAVDFGGVQQGAYSPIRTLTLRNLGDRSIALGPHTVGAPFSIAGGTCGGTLAGNSQCELALQFQPDALGPRLGSLTVASDSVGGPIDVTLRGEGTTAPPVAALTPGSADFGSVGLGVGSASRFLVVSNTGQGALTVAGVTIGGANAADFAVVSDSCTGAVVTEGGSCAVAVAFAPTAGGARTASLVVAHDGANSPVSAALTGTGVAPTGVLSSTSLSFGKARPGGTTAPQTVELRNDGPGLLEVATVALSGADAASFAIVGDTCAAAALAPGETCQVSVSFAPDSTGTKTASLVLTSNASGGSHVVSLTGGAAPARGRR